MNSPTGWQSQETNMGYALQQSREEYMKCELRIIHPDDHIMCANCACHEKKDNQWLIIIGPGEGHIKNTFNYGVTIAFICTLLYCIQERKQVILPIPVLHFVQWSLIMKGLLLALLEWKLEAKLCRYR